MNTVTMRCIRHFRILFSELIDRMVCDIPMLRRHERNPPASIDRMGSPDVTPAGGDGETQSAIPTRTEVLVVGAGPAGSAAAAWAARDGRDVVLTDSAVFPRDKTC